jgi:hypothetical protein
MGQSRRMRQAYQHLHGGPMPAGQKPIHAVLLQILIATTLRDEIVKEFESLKSKPTDITLQDFHERLLVWGLKSMQQAKAQQEEEASIVKLAGAPDLARLAAKGVVR